MAGPTAQREPRGVVVPTRFRPGVRFEAPPPVALDMVWSIIAYSISEGVALPQSVTPLFGTPDGYEYKERPAAVGDVAAKAEARRMIEESKVEEIIPVDFEEGRVLAG